MDDRATRGLGYDRRALRAAAARLARAPTFDAAEQALGDLAAHIGMPLMAWCPDVGRPYFDPRMDAFLHRHGWDDDVLGIWWDRHVMLRMPLYLRCRVEHLPFVSAVDPDLPGQSADERRIMVHMAGRGMRSMVTAPILLPRGRIAMLNWVGERTPAEAVRLVDDIGHELLYAAHCFMRAYDRDEAGDRPAEEASARLTPREWDCLRLAAQGYRDPEIARLMGLAPTTVRFHMDNAVSKLGAANRTHAVALAAQLGMLGTIVT